MTGAKQWGTWCTRVWIDSVVVVVDVEWLVEVEHCGVVVESSWAVEHLER